MGKKVRAELLCKTKHAEGYGIESLKDLILGASELGMPAIGIVDEGSVEAFALADRFYEDAIRRGDITSNSFRFVYGVELSVFDDSNCREIPTRTHDIMRLDRYQLILYAKNQTGIRDLYRLVSLQGTINHTPYVPFSEVEKCRENLLVGVHGLPRCLIPFDFDEFYPEFCKQMDFCLIEPLENYYKIDSLHDEKEDYEEYKSATQKLVLELTESNVCVIATANVCYLSPKDEFTFRAYVNQEGLNCEQPRPGYKPKNYLMMSDEELIDSFSFLGKKVAKDIVVNNSLKLLGQIEEIQPLNNKRLTPVYPNAEKELKSICKKSAEAIYGKKLPALVKDRMEKELAGITANGFASLYMFSAKIAEKARNDGKPFALRGNGSGSFVSFLAGITSVNPLPPHYYCKECHYSEFEGPWKEKLPVGNVGLDLPAKKCPNCGKKLVSDGYDIPAYFLLGFHYDKEPDFDFNVPAEYQATIQQYIPSIEGIGYACHAGTICTYSPWQAFHMVEEYAQKKNRKMDSERIRKYAAKLTDKVISYGIHPGGVVIFPEGADIYEYTPITQRPDQPLGAATGIEYYKIGYNVTKLDILGHDTPSALLLAEKYSNKKWESIPLTDKKMLELFSSPDGLGFIKDCPKEIITGTLGIPSFTATFNQRAFKEAPPESYSDIIRLLGCFHGTNSWTDNAEVIIKENIAPLRNCIAHREDIYLYLVDKGIDSESAWKIADQCRKGKFARFGIPEEWKELLKSHDVPDWYIDSMEKIRYLFPKSHAASYLQLDLRLLYYKLHYPEAFYRAWFASISYYIDKKLLKKGEDAIKKEYFKTMKKVGGEDDSSSDYATELLVVLEMYARGVDIQKIIETEKLFE